MYLSTVKVGSNVRNLPTSITADALQQLFEPYGTVADVQLAIDQEPGRHRGWGHVEMPDVSEAQKAMAKLNWLTIEGQRLSLAKAYQQAEREGPQRPRGRGVLRSRH